MADSFGRSCFSHLIQDQEQQNQPAADPNPVEQEEEEEEIKVGELPDGTFALREYNLDDVPNQGILMFYGGTGRGKSFALRSFIYHLDQKEDFGAGMVISGTEHHAEVPFYSQFIDDVFIHPEIHPDVLVKLVERQTQVHANNKGPNPYKLANGDPIRRKCLIVFDDTQGDLKAWHQPKINEFAFQARHHDLLIPICVQAMTKMPNQVRRAATVSVFVQETNTKALKSIHEEFFANFIPDYRTFLAVFKKYTSNYTCLVVKNKNTSSELEDNVFWFKAKTPPADWKFGPPSMQKFANEMRKTDSQASHAVDWSKGFVVGHGAGAPPIKSNSKAKAKTKAQPARKLVLLSADGTKVVAQ